LDGRYRIDNNLAENAIRPIAVGRKNYLFCGNDSAAEDAAIMYSLLGCCKAIDVNFRDWMVYVLSKYMIMIPITVKTWQNSYPTTGKCR